MGRVVMRKKELKKLIDEVFKFYGRRALIEDDFYGYFLERGFSREEIEDLWMDAMAEDLIEVGVTPILDPENPYEIVGKKFVFELKEEMVKII